MTIDNTITVIGVHKNAHRAAVLIIFSLFRHKHANCSVVSKRTLKQRSSRTNLAATCFPQTSHNTAMAHSLASPWQSIRFSCRSLVWFIFCLMCSYVMHDNERTETPNAALAKFKLQPYDLHQREKSKSSQKTFITTVWNNFEFWLTMSMQLNYSQHTCKMCLSVYCSTFFDDL